jgi:hypothetical protein
MSEDPDIEETYLSSVGWGPRARQEFLTELRANGWQVDRLYDHGAIHCTRSSEYIHLSLEESSINFTYKRDPAAKALGGMVLRSGRDAKLLFVGINEQLASAS